jgi:hypothetical protein
MRRLLALAVLAGTLAVPAAATAAGPPAPTLTADTKWAPSSGGIVRQDFTTGTTASDVPNAIAVDGDRSYTVGETRDTTSDSNIAIVARKSDGSFDTGFSGDGKLVIEIAPGTGRDLAAGVIVLGDHTLRIVGATDIDPGSGTNLNAVIVGLKPDGAPLPGFGDAHGVVSFAVGSFNDLPNRIAVDPATGRLAIAGAAKQGSGDSSEDDFFVSLRNADGTPVAGFGTNGVKTIDQSGGTMNDRGIDAAFRPGGGIVALVQNETNPDSSATDYRTVLRAFNDLGQPDTRFSDDGILVVNVADTDTVPGGIVPFGGRLWFAGSTKKGNDTNAFLARVNADGTGLESRQFDMRGTLVGANEAVTSQALDLAPVTGPEATMVVVGSTTSAQGTDWAGAAFNKLGGPLADMGYGDLILPTPGQGALVGVAADGPNSLAVAGSILDTSTIDTSIGNARLLVDADKQCDMALEVSSPLEAIFRNGAPVTMNLKATNNGTKTCAGTISVGAPYGLAFGGGATIPTGTVAAGDSFVASGVQLSYSGPRKREDVVVLTLDAPGDANAADNTRQLHSVFSYCDLRLSLLGAVGAVPTEGSRRFEVGVRNTGTSACRGVRLGVESGGTVAGTPDRYRLESERTVTDEIRVKPDAGGKLGDRKRIVLRVGSSSADLDPGDNRLTVSPKLVRVGDSRARRPVGQTISGTASRGKGPIKASKLRVARVDIALRRVGGKGCTWLRSTSGAFRTSKAGKSGCTTKHWVRAHGTTQWRVTLGKRLASGRYELYSRAVIRAGFAEARFSAADGNLVKFTR